MSTIYDGSHLSSFLILMHNKIVKPRRAPFLSFFEIFFSSIVVVCGLQMQKLLDWVSSGAVPSFFVRFPSLVVPVSRCMRATHFLIIFFILRVNDM